MSSQSNNVYKYAILNKMIDARIKSLCINKYSKEFAILLNILVEIIVSPLFEKYHSLCETLFYNNYHYVNTLLQGDNIVGAAEDYETLCQVISLIKEEIIEGSEDIDNKKIVEKLVVYYCE
jgi:hypothetical protein